MKHHLQAKEYRSSCLPFRTVFLLVSFLAVWIQVVVIIYNHLSGYSPLSGFQGFLLRWFLGSFLSIMAGLCLAYPDLQMIRYLSRTYPWGKKSLQRILIQILFSIALATLISTLITLISHTIGRYHHSLGSVLLNNALIFSVANLFIMTLLEAGFYYCESKKSREIADQLKEELTGIRFEILKSQINPHFMFNSLNVLSGLIRKNPAAAQDFVDEFSHVYRYVLETIDKQVITLNRELDFVKSYLFLQQIRYGKGFTHQINLPAHILHHWLPPLSMQVILENALKHNIVIDSKPLSIEVYYQAPMLIIRNTLQFKPVTGTSTGIGLQNLSRRYALLGADLPVFGIENNFYIAKLPLIPPETDENTDR